MLQIEIIASCSSVLDWLCTGYYLFDCSREPNQSNKLIFTCILFKLGNFNFNSKTINRNTSQVLIKNFVFLHSGLIEFWMYLKVKVWD